MQEFRKFSNLSLEFGEYDSCHEVAPEKRSGAFLVFDAWKESNNYFQFRIFHFKKDQEIIVESKGCSILERKCVEDQRKDTWYDFESDEEKEGVNIEYMTAISWKIDDPFDEGFFKVDVVGEDLDYYNLDDEAKVSWKDGVLKDFGRQKADLTLEGNRLIISERLTKSEKEQFALSDRVNKLKKICQKKMLVTSFNQLNLNWIAGHFDLERIKKYEEWLDSLDPED